MLITVAIQHIGLAFGKAFDTSGAFLGIIGIDGERAEWSPLAWPRRGRWPTSPTRLEAGNPDEQRAALEGRMPPGRFGSPAEVAPAALRSSEQAGSSTRVVLPVDCGLSM